MAPWCVYPDTYMPQGPSGSTPCHVGEYHDMGLGSCTPCTNPVPHGVSYISSSSTYGVSGCPWRCPDPPYHMPFVCPISTSSVPGGALGVDAQGDRVVVCDPGLYKPYPNSTHCQLCSQGFYCTGLNEGLTGIQECPQNTTSYSGMQPMPATLSRVSRHGMVPAAQY